MYRRQRHTRRQPPFGAGLPCQWYRLHLRETWV